ncbi:MAG: formate dehydrogenase accessory sulfurtransferase FdhD [Bacteroidia bacterium]
MPQPFVKPITITRFEHDQTSTVQELLAGEEPLEIRIGYGPEKDRQQKNIAVTMRTPGNDFELALGFLFTEGIIQSGKQVHSIHYCTEVNTLENKENIVRVELDSETELDFTRLQRNFYTTSSCGVCGKESIESVKTVCPFPQSEFPFEVNRHVLQGISQTLREAQQVFAYTGGLHASGLFDFEGRLLLLREDVGRHNALDKLIGAVLGGVTLQKTYSIALPLSNYVLLLSGRASFELIQKAAMAGIRLVCAIGAPSSLAVQMADELNITLIGFLKEHRFNIYTHPHRVIL